MGTRVLIVCTDGKSVSVGVFKNFDGYLAPTIIAAAHAMACGHQVSPDRASVLITAAAVNNDIESSRRADRFPRREAPLIWHDAIGREVVAAILTLWGLQNTVHAKARAKRDLLWHSSEMSLEAGFVIVDVSASEWTWRAFCGELARPEDGGPEVEGVAV